MTDDKPVKVGRLALRHEGKFWNAYYALPDSMDQAILLGSIAIAAVERQDRKQAFMDLMRDVVGDLLQEKTGHRPTWPEGAHTAPEAERARARVVRSTLHTKDILAAELEKAGLHDMATKAATGYYHDFLSPLDLPEMQLAADLAAAGTPEALALRERHINGEFDATKEESDAWAESDDGQEALGRLVKGGP